MGQGAAVNKLALYGLWGALHMLAPSAQACACCLDTGQYSVQRGVDGYLADEILAFKKPLRATMDFGLGNSNTAFASPAMNMQRGPTEFGLTWYITLTERDPVTQGWHTVALRFTPEPAKKWTYIRRSSPLLKQQEQTGLAHDFLIQGRLVVVSDKAKLMRGITKITAQLTLYGTGNNCFAGDQLNAFMLDMQWVATNGDRSQLVGQGRIK
jgi:hypothetical protein